MRWGRTSQSWGRGQAKCWHWCLPMWISKPFWALRSASVLPPPCRSTSPSLLGYTTEISPAYFHGDVCCGAYRKHLGVFADPGKDGELPEWRETAEDFWPALWHHGPEKNQPPDQRSERLTKMIASSQHRCKADEWACCSDEEVRGHQRPPDRPQIKV